MGAMYQRCMQHIFGDHIGRTVEAYVDDIVVKNRKADDLVSDLHVAFNCLRATRVKLNPKKCVFGVPRSMLLLTVKIRQPSHEFTFGVGITFVSYSLVLTPVV
jgi:hypothetical protein